MIVRYLDMLFKFKYTTGQVCVKSDKSLSQGLLKKESCRLSVRGLHGKHGSFPLFHGAVRPVRGLRALRAQKEDCVKLP